MHQNDNNATILKMQKELRKIERFAIVYQLNLASN